MSLKDLDIKDTYSSGAGNVDLVLDFYNPVIEQAVSYDRITGFFSPSVLAVASRGFASLISTGGKIRLISSVQVDDRTYELISSENYKFGDDFLEDFDLDTIRSEIENDYLSVFAWLYKNGQLEMKIAITNREKSMLHQKIGIITDSDCDSISFSGSNNETPNGWRHNIEQFKVFKSWNPHTTTFYESDREEFDTLWNDLSMRAKVISVDIAIKEKLVQKIEKRRKGNIKDVVDRIKLREHINSPRITFAHGQDSHFFEGINKHDRSSERPKRNLRPYQEEAIKKWVSNGYKYIFEMATGSGKTFTALSGLQRFKNDKGFVRCLIVVPLLTLVEQWEAEVKSTLGPISTIVADGSNPQWRSDVRRLAQAARLGNDSDFVIVTTYSTFSTQDFRDLMDGFPNEDVILLADEMHNLVTENSIKSASSNKFKYRLGLSATPTRLWKPEESTVTRRLFGGESFVYSLGDAINDKALVEYEYHALPVHLTEGEYEEYESLSREASKLSHYASDSKGASPLARVLTRRAIIKKQAENKFVLLEQLIDKLRDSGTFNHSLIYVDSNPSLETVQKILTKKFIKSSKFTGEESSETRNSVIKSLDLEMIEAIVAIKCLDEGVDIPSAKNGIFLSNNTDPREYVQRLGRVLRRHDGSNKNVAHVYDFLVLPPQSVSTSNTIARNLVKSELIRAKFFEKLAKNSTDVNSELGNMLDIYGFYFEPEELMRHNTEEDE